MHIYFVLIVTHAVHSNRQRIRRKSQIYHRSNIVVNLIMPRTGQQGNCNSTTNRNKRFFCLHIIHTFSCARTASCPMNTGVTRPRLKRGHLPPYSAEVENAWSFPSTFIARKSTTLLHLNRAYFSRQGPLRANEYVRLAILEARSKIVVCVCHRIS